MGFLKWLMPSRAVPAAAVQKVNAANSDFEVPRYPPFMKGLPAIPPSRLLDSQQELLEQLARVVTVNKQQYSEHYLGILNRFASYVHLLPASQSHHHRGAGGLLRHSMEVGLWSLQAGDKLLLDLGKTPAVRRKVEPRWQLTSFIAGLCHDVGKPATDIVVSSGDRAQVWKPIKENLSDWADQHGISAYFIDWRQGRGKQHLALANLIAERIIGTETLSWIEEGGTDLIVWLMETLNENPGARNPLCDLVKLADQSSVERDMKTMGVAMAGYELGVPVERHLTDIMRRLIKEGVWLVNEPGARVWKIDGATFLVWPSGGDEVARQVREDGVPGFPRTADGILDMLLERDLAHVRESAETNSDRFWKIAPEVLSVKIPNIAMSCIRLRDDALISSMPLTSVPGKVLNGAEDGEDKGGADNASSETPQAPAQDVRQVAEEAPKASVATVEQKKSAPRKVRGKADAEDAAGEGSTQSAPKAPAKKIVDPETGEILGMEVTDADGQVRTLTPRTSGPIGEGKKSLSSPVGIRLKTQNPEGEETPEARDPSGSPAGDQAPTKVEDSPPAQPSEEPKVSKKPRGKKTIDLSQAPTLVFDGALGMLLMAIVDDIKSGSKAWGQEARVDAEEMVFLRWPQAFAGYGLSPKNILDEGKSKDWFWIDPYMPMTPVLETEFGKETVKAVRLNPEPSYTFLHCAGYSSEAQTGSQKRAKDSAAPAQVAQDEPSTPVQPAERSKQAQAAQVPRAQQEPRRRMPEPPPPEEIPFCPPEDYGCPPTLDEYEREAIPAMPCSEPVRRQMSVPVPSPERDIPNKGASSQPKRKGDGAQLDLPEMAEAKERTAGPGTPNPTGGKSQPQAPRNEAPAAQGNQSAPGVNNGGAKAPGRTHPKTGELLQPSASVKQFDDFMALLASMPGEVNAKGWKALDRTTCIALCKSRGLDLRRRTLQSYLETASDRLRVDGNSLFFKMKK